MTGGQNLTKELWGLKCKHKIEFQKVNKTLGNQAPKKRPAEFVTVDAGSVLFWRGDIPHRHVKHSHHIAIIHGNAKFIKCQYALNGEGTNMSPKVITEYLEGEDVSRTMTEPKDYNEMVSKYKKGIPFYLQPAPSIGSDCAQIVRR